MAAAEAAAIDTRVYGATPSLTFAVKGGRVSSRSAALLDLFRVRPVILFDGHDGSVHIDGATSASRGRWTAWRSGLRLSLTVIRSADRVPRRIAAAGERLLDALRRRFPPKRYRCFNQARCSRPIPARERCGRRETIASVREAWRD